MIKKQIRTIIDYNKAVEVIEANTTLSAKTMFKLGRVADKTASIRNRFTKTVEKATREGNIRISALQERFKNTKEEEEKRKISLEVVEINSNINSTITSLLDNEEEIEDLPSFTLEEFADKEGKSLVNQGFFTLIGNLITTP